jgi:sortase A
MVFGLVMSIVLAGGIVVYGLAHRLQVGPGMRAVAVVAAVPLATSEAPPALAPTLPPMVPPPQETIPVAAAGAPPTSIPEPTLPLQAAIGRPPAQSPPTRLTIAKIGLDIPVLSVGTTLIPEGSQSKVVWGDVPNAGAFHSTSAYPGNIGNTVINGHRDIQGAVFRHLDRLEVGDEIVLYVGEVPYVYRVVQVLVVPETFASAAQKAENLRLIGFLPEERLTLVTCTPVGLATHRLLVIARPADQGEP